MSIYYQEDNVPTKGEENDYHYRQSISAAMSSVNYEDVENSSTISCLESTREHNSQRSLSWSRVMWCVLGLHERDYAMRVKVNTAP